MTGHHQAPARGAGARLRVMQATPDGDAIDPSLLAACQILQDTHAPLTSISVSGRLPSPELGPAQVLATAERLAAEYGLVIELRLDGAAYELHLRRRAS